MLCGIERGAGDHNIVKASQVEKVMVEAGTKALESLASALGKGKHPPVEKWNPPFCGDLDMRIATDGTWFYLGTPIGRPALVRLFASVIKREEGRYFLVTPVEKVGIRVEDAPFLAVEMEIENRGPKQSLIFRTNVDDVVRCDADHRLRFEPEVDTGGLRPYLHVRRDLWAKVTRALFFDLVVIGEVREEGGERMFGVASSGEFFAMAPEEAIAGYA
jgi:hypothetical protein